MILHVTYVQAASELVPRLALLDLLLELLACCLWCDFKKHAFTICLPRYNFLRHGSKTLPGFELILGSMSCLSSAYSLAFAFGLNWLWGNSLAWVSHFGNYVVDELCSVTAS